MVFADASELLLFPAAVIAITVNVYALPFVSLVTMQVVVADVQAVAAGLGVTT